MYEIEAEYAEQQDDNEVELQNVEINYTTEANVPWTLNADTAPHWQRSGFRRA